ncbi:hypothetical protein AWC38_SpisGene23265 [Stylophora pistillata]|uniref:Reverse transcriptase domain-containing protein n=1 Tax=Stylophora pistillata TaxID=50429 RepID=A0A2B4R304_STYPI|nr:hypothetical protein AWC38_SpisGene23265 [Stylophora pistillata]
MKIFPEFSWPLHFLQNWELLTSDQWTLNTVGGYRLELTGSPRQLRLPSPHHLNPSKLALVEDEITSLLDKKAIVSVPHHRKLFYSNLFLVEKRGEGHHPVIKLSSLNSFVHHHHFKMEDLKVVADILCPQDVMSKIDLKDAYFAVPIDLEHQKLLCFQFQNVTYQFKCLPFSLTSAPRVFTKVLKPLVAFEMEFLGVLVSSIHMSFSLPDSKVVNLQNECRRLLSSKTPSQSDLAHLSGKMIAAKAAVFQAPLHYRALQHQKNSLDIQRVPVHQKVIFDVEALLDLEWSNAQLERFYSYLPDPLAEQFDALVQPWREENAYAFPPFQLDQQISEEDKPRKSNTVDCLPSVASAGMQDGVLGITSLQKASQKKLQIFSSLPNADQQMLSTSLVGLSGVTGVANNRLITFDQLSAISSTVPPLVRTPLARHKIVCSFMKGVFNKRPPKPRYSNTWEVSLVTGLFEKWPINRNLELKCLSRKCAILLALISAKQQSDLHALDLEFVQFLPEGVEFRIPGLTKTRTPGKDVVFFFPALEDNVQLCPMACLREYIKKTEKLCNHGGVNKPSFLATQKPFSPVSLTSISRWLKLTLQDTGIDTSVFKAHLTQGASSSAARQGGVSVKDILAAADWSRETTFNHFYRRPRHSASFGRAVIS